LNLVFDLFRGAVKTGISRKNCGAAEASKRVLALAIGTGKPPVWF
jgi:hypothetical protein